MKAERIGLKQEFVPVIVTLENQEEVDALHTIANHIAIVNPLPVLNDWFIILRPFTSIHWRRMWERLNRALHQY